MSVEVAVERTSPRWQPIETIERRVLGVLIEKAKTTPENYPLSLNSLRAGCNQKNNRAPLMQLEEDQVEQALENLRKLGAVAQIQGGGRVDKYRHLAYDWLGVEKVELAVMAELLLRGTQTVGELRGRAARMEPIKDLTELQPTLDALRAKGLIIYLSPPGRGSLVTHALYLERELDKVRRDAGLTQPASAAAYHDDESAEAHLAATTADAHHRSVSSDHGGPGRAPTRSLEAANLSAQVQHLEQELADVKSELLSIRTEFNSTLQLLQRDLAELNRQLGNEAHSN
jgi:uncharacterized protein YceH (UPF0502 family)